MSGQRAGVVGLGCLQCHRLTGAAALARPLAVVGILAPAVATAILPVALLALTPGGRLTRSAGAVLIADYAGWVTAVLAR